MDRWLSIVRGNSIYSGYKIERDAILPLNPIANTDSVLNDLNNSESSVWNRYNCGELGFEIDRPITFSEEDSSDEEDNQ